MTHPAVAISPALPSLPADRRIGPLSVAILIAAYVGLWAYVTPYGELGHDAQGYALQALAKLAPDTLGGDLFLQYRSQTDFTIFPTIYAWFIVHVGLENAAAGLTLALQAAWFCAAWGLLRKLAGTSLAWFGLGLLVVAPCPYGGLRVFHLVEPFLTARLPGEVLSLAAIWLFAAGRPLLCVGSLLLAFTLHPLMTFPVALVLATSWAAGRMRLRTVLILVAAGIGVALVGATIFGAGSPTMTGRWLQLTRIRSGFLFLDQWMIEDWNQSFQPLITLALGAFAIRSIKAGRIALAALLVGLAGLALALICSMWSHSTILLQGQPWRWIWPARVLATGLLPLILWSLWTRSQTGRASALLLVASWLTLSPLPGHDNFSAMLGSMLALLALVVIGFERRFTAQTAKAVFSGALLVVVASSCAAAFSAWLVHAASLREAGRVSVQTVMASLLTTTPPAALLAIGSCALVLARRGLAWTVAGAALAIFLLASVAPIAINGWSTQRYSGAAQAQFEDWRSVIPPKSEVLWSDDPRETWFLLQRRSYLSRSQSGGVVFSEELADEVVRRAMVLEPYIRRGYWILDPADIDARPYPLSAGILHDICQDHELGFVVSEDDIGVGAPQKSWPTDRDHLFLYDCKNFR